MVPHRGRRRAVHARDRRRAGLAARVPGHAHGPRGARGLQPRERRALAHADPRLRARHRGLGDRERRRRRSPRPRSSSSCSCAARPRSRRPGQRMLPQLRAARDLGLRSFAFTAAFLLAASVAARMGDAQVAAHQIGFQLWIFVALVLDSVAIAAQALIGRLLGAGAVDAAATLARRLLVAGLVFGIAVGALFAAGSHVVPGALHLGRRRAPPGGRAVAVARRDDARGRRAVRPRRRLLRRRRPRLPAPRDAVRLARRSSCRS